MTERTRADLLAEAKRRALVHVDTGNLARAISSMLSDMDNLPDSTRDGNDAQGAVAMGYAMACDADGMRRWIEGVQ